ncbi:MULTISPECIES: hypothetical protein [Bacillaceae]|uniref:Uncharacterized protein n=1 Tax=Alkalicoccobacillus plakortidis TaxID=444060 RepID=A0A9D5I2N7_9BACI|nr:MULTISPECIES: hypothetical protein [Bacillaceae]KQL58972.1 hypothetical protein AN965_00815 [Alkalicoccobacillus plakortidis]
MIHLTSALQIEQQIIDIGDGGEYESITEAIGALITSGATRSNSSVTLNLLKGFVLKEQIHIENLNLDWVTILSEDSIVPIQASAISETLIESRRPAFLGRNQATLPTIGVLFEYDTQTARCDGITVAFGSKVRLLPGAGVNYADRGLGAYYHSEAFCYMEGLTEGGGGIGAGDVTGVSFRYCSNRAFMASFGSKINCARSILDYCSGDNAVYAIWGSFCDIYQSNVSHATNTAVHSRDGSKVNARETNVSHSNRGFHALHNGTINARYAANKWAGDGAKNCRGYGVMATYNSHIDAADLPVDGSHRGFHASTGSTINASTSSAKNCTIGYHATGASTINAQESDASGASWEGFFAEKGSIINADRSLANDCREGFSARFNSIINADTSSAQRARNNGFFANETSTIQARNSVANQAMINGFLATRSSTINARGSNARSCNGNGFRAEEGSSLNANSGDATGSGNEGLDVFRGSFISAQNSIGSLRLPERLNQLTREGAIFR